MKNKRVRICSLFMAVLFLFTSLLTSVYTIGYRTAFYGVSLENSASEEEADSQEDSDQAEEVIDKDDYVIQDEDDFMAFMENCRLDEWSLNRKIKLTNDLNLRGSRYDDFDGISSFSGTFYGNDHTISGIELTGGTEAVGLFHYLEQEGTIRDLNVSIIIHSDNSADILGGIVGVNSGTIKDCHFDGYISGNGTTGGIAGYNGNSGTIDGCKAAGTIKSAHTVGGIAGENRGIITDCVNASEVNSDSTWFEEDSDSSMTMSLSGLVDTGTEMILNGTDIGGIAGFSDGIIAGCQNTSTVGYLHTGRNIGGIAGRQSGDIIRCKNTGSIYGKQDVGGIVGLMEPALTYQDAEKLNDEVDALHDDIDTLISDMDNMGDSVHSDLDDLASHADTAVDTTNAITSELRDVVRTDVDVINDLSTRLTYVVNHMPDVLDYLDEALNSMEDLGDDFAKIKDDVDIETKMEEETYDPAEDHRLTLQSGAGGTIKADNLNPAEGAEVTITVQPSDGYRLSKLQYKPYQGEEKEITSEVTGDRYHFTMPAENVTIQAIFAYTGDYIAKSNAGGRIELEQGTEQVRIRAIPYGGYDLERVTAGGTDITASFAEDNGILTAVIDKKTSDQPILVEGTFASSDTTHPIVLESSTGGTIASDQVQAASGDTVTITVSEARNYALQTLTAATEEGTNIPVTASGEKTHTFTMPDRKVTVTGIFQYVPDADTTVYTESGIGGLVEAVPNPMNNDYYITMTPESGYKVGEAGTVLEIYENGNAAPVKQLTRDELEESAGTYRYTLNSMNYTAPIRVMGYFTEVPEASHIVTVISGTGGTVTSDHVRISAGEELKLAVANESGYVLSSLTINGEEYVSQVEDGILTWKVPDTLSGDISVAGTFSPVLLIIQSPDIGGNAAYTTSGDQVTITVTSDSGYAVEEPLKLTDYDGSDILYQKQYANSNIYSFAITEAMKQGHAATLELHFLSMNDKETVEHAKDQLSEDSVNFSDSLAKVSATTDAIRDLMTDDFGEVRSAEDLTQEEMDQLQELLLTLSDELGDSGTYAASMIRSLNTIVVITTPYVEDAVDALQKDLDLVNEDYQNMIHAFQGASAETRAIVDYLNALEELKFKNLSTEFDLNSDKLSAELNTIIDIMRRLNDHVDLYSDKIENDMRAVNDRLNTIFDLILVRMDTIEDLSNGKDLLEDHSADEELTYDTSLVTACTNSGRINGDINIGGITGSIGREADESNTDTDRSGTVGSKYIVCAIIQECTNDGFIRVKTENGGGIAGNMTVGLIRASLSEGSVASPDGRCLGGIAGYSTGTIQSCSSKTELSGGQYIGGIAGRASAIKNCFSMASVTESVARVGAIAAEYIPDESASDDMTVYRRSLKTDYVDNYYVSSSLYGIDGVSYANVAEPVTYSEMLQMDGVDRSFKTMNILFVDDEDQLIDHITTRYGTQLSEIDFPLIQTDDGDYYEWDGPDTELVESDLVYRAVLTANVTVLQSAQKLNGKSLALAEGVYTESTTMNVEEVSMDVPSSVSGNAVTHMERVTITDSSLKDDDEIKLRLLDIEGADNCVVYVYRNDGWRKMDQTDAGNYIQVTMRGTDEIFCLASEPRKVNYILIGGIAGAVGFGIVLLILLLVYRGKKKKA